MGNAQTDHIDDDPSVQVWNAPENLNEPDWWSPTRPLGELGHTVSVGFMNGPDGRPIPTDLRIELCVDARIAARGPHAIPPALSMGLIRGLGLDSIKKNAVQDKKKADQVNLITRAVIRGHSQEEIQAELTTIEPPAVQTPRRRGPASRMPLTGEELIEISNANPGDVAGACHRAIREIAYKRGCLSSPCCEGQFTTGAENIQCPHDFDDTHIRRVKRQARNRGS